MSLKYRITLTEDERAKLESLTRNETTPSRKILHARTLLLCDAGPAGPAWKIADVATKLGMSSRTVGHLKRRCVKEGIDAALERKTRNKPSRNIIFDQKFETRLLALAGSKPPPGHRRWTVRLLADKAVENGLTPCVSHMTIHRILKKLNINLSTPKRKKSNRKAEGPSTVALKRKRVGGKIPTLQPAFTKSPYETAKILNLLNSDR